MFSCLLTKKLSYDKLKLIYNEIYIIMNVMFYEKK